MTWAGPLAVIGAGARTSLGSGLPASAAAARAGVCQFADHPFMVDDHGFPIVVARDPFLAPGVERVSRLSAMAASAALECLEGVDQEDQGRPQTLLLLALPRGREGGPVDDARLVRELLALLEHRVDVVAVRRAALGHVAGVQALAECARAFAEGFEQRALVVGVDSWLDPPTLEWLDGQETLRTEKRPFGFLPGEAAVALLVEPADRGRQALARVEGCALRTESDLAPDRPRLGLALTEAARAACDLWDDPSRIADALYADLNGDPGRADEVGYATVRVRDRLSPEHALRIPAECFGDVGAATVPLMVALALERAQNTRGGDASALLLAQSMASERAAVLLTLPSKGRAS